MKELVGQGKPFYSGLDKAAGLLRRKVGTGSEFLKELMSIPGVKQAEIAERGLGELLNAPKMTHEQFVAALGSKPAPAIGERVMGGEPDPADVIRRTNANMRNFASENAESAENSREAREMKADELRRLRENHRAEITQFSRNELEDEDNTHHEQYTLPGGENYREMLIKAPKGGDQFQGVRQHFGGEEGILASMRLKDRTGPNGEKLLHLEELQSDWHQQGREKGYRGDHKSIDWNNPEYVAARKRAMELGNEFNRNSGRPDLQAEIEPLLEEANRVERSFADINNKFGNAVPNAPFKKNWEEMALKRLIHHAAENGYHGVVVTPGKEQADRYNLAKQIDALEWDQRTGRLYAKPKNGNDFNKMADGVTEENLSNYIGKEAAEKLMAQPSTGTNRQLNGVDLQVGGEGMKGFYDKKVPNILNSIGKKYGVKTELGGHKLPGDPSQRGDASERLGLAGERLADMSPEQVQAFNQKLDDANAKQLHYFPITEEMRQDVKQNGIPLYKSGGSVSTH